jgi:hypothetical protein
MVTAGDRDLSSLPTAATRAWMMLETVRTIIPRCGWMLDIATVVLERVVLVVRVGEEAVGKSRK